MFEENKFSWKVALNQTFKWSILATALASFGIFSGCSSTGSGTTGTKKTHNTKHAKTLDDNDDLLDANSLDSLEELLYATDMRAVENDRLMILRYGDVWKRVTVGFKMNLNVSDPRIDAQRSWFISRQPYLDRLSARASRYLYYTVKEAEKHGIPTELALLPIIESSYDPAATSTAAAAGLWQFIPSTGKVYGLRQSSTYDGRRDVVESTRAAYEYLTSLYNQFGSWELALASYNAGPGRIQQAINRNAAAGLPTDYWSLRLPTETMNYVPRFLAVAQIIKNPERYGVHLPAIANRPHFREVAIPGSIDLEELSKLIGVSRGELYALNPGHRANYTDPSAPLRILIPNDVSITMDKKIANLPVKYGTGGAWTGKAEFPTVKNTNTQTTQKQPWNNGTVVSSQPLTKQQNVNTQVSTGKMPTPTNADDLAKFANNADKPSAPRVPVSITPVLGNTTAKAEPPLTEAEKQQINITVQNEQKKSGTPESSVTVVKNEPEISKAEKQKIIEEIKEVSPKGTEVVNPEDGKVQLTALQSSSSVAEQKGEENKLNYAYPKAVAKAEAEAHTETAQRNQGKPYVETTNEVVVVAPKGKRTVYQVQSKDTLSLIAQKFSVNVQDIAKWNQIDVSSPLLVGTTLYLYNAKEPQVEKKPETTQNQVYVVKAGDTLSGIANTHGMSLQKLAELNNLAINTNVIVGQKLFVAKVKDDKATKKDDKKSNKVHDKTTVSTSNKIATETYTVKKGESLQIIAARYKLKVSDVVELNPKLKNNTALLVGQKIQLPKDVLNTSTTAEKTTEKVSNHNVHTIRYTVVSGDTLKGIATKHKTTVAQLKELNANIGNTVKVGQKINVPATNTEQTVSERLNSTNKNTKTYVSQNGDTLASVAKKFGLSVQQLAHYNHLKTTAKLTKGTILNLEENKTVGKNVSENKAEKNSKEDVATGNYKGATESHTVQAGESLASLAARYKITVNDLAGLNKLSSKAQLRKNQKILVPKLTTTYKVKSGDSLIKIAQRYKISAKELATMNGLKPNEQVHIGQTLTVPNK